MFPPSGCSQGDRSPFWLSFFFLKRCTTCCGLTLVFQDTWVWQKLLLFRTLRYTAIKTSHCSGLKYLPFGKPTRQYSANYSSSQMDIMRLTITNDCLSLFETETVIHPLALAPIELSDCFLLIGQSWFPQSWLVVGPAFPDRNISICNHCEWKFPRCRPKQKVDSFCFLSVCVTGITMVSLLFEVWHHVWNLG